MMGLSNEKRDKQDGLEACALGGLCAPSSTTELGDPCLLESDADFFQVQWDTIVAILSA